MSKKLATKLLELCKSIHPMTEMMSSKEVEKAIEAGKNPTLGAAIVNHVVMNPESDVLWHASVVYPEAKGGRKQEGYLEIREGELWSTIEKPNFSQNVYIGNENIHKAVGLSNALSNGKNWESV